MFKHNKERFYHYLHIKCKAPGFYVLSVKPHDFLKVGYLASPRYLPEACYARLDSHPCSVAKGIHLEFLYRRRPCPDKAHVALQYVEELRELIQAGLAQLVADSKCTETGNVRILAECLTNLPLYVT